MSQILVVDDEAPIREVLIELLTDYGYTAQGAESGSQALSLARSLRPLIVMLDIWMPAMDGIETLKRLRRLPNPPAVIMISGHSDHDVALKALEHGAYDFIQKPLDFQYLERTLLAKLVTLDVNRPLEAEEETANVAAASGGKRLI